MAEYTPGQRVSFKTNFYAQPEHQEGVGTVDRVESCGTDPEKCCGPQCSTVFVEVDSTNQTLAYISKELSPVV